MLTLVYFHWESATFLLSGNIDIDYILIHNFYFYFFFFFFLVFKGSFNKHVLNKLYYDDVSKVDHSRPS